MVERVEPWLRGTHREVDACRRQVIHALEQALEDSERWCFSLTDEEMELRPFGVAPVGFHLRHIARSLDRLLTYAEGRSLTGFQMEALRAEMRGGGDDLRKELLTEVRGAMDRVRLLEEYEGLRLVGRDGLPSTVGGLMVHSAEHTQRHVGQAVTTAKVVVGMRGLV